MDFHVDFVWTEDCLSTTWLLNQPVKALNCAMHHKQTCLISWYLNIGVDCNTLTFLVLVSMLKQDLTLPTPPQVCSGFQCRLTLNLSILTATRTNQIDLAEIVGCRTRGKEVITLLCNRDINRV